MLFTVPSTGRYKNFKANYTLLFKNTNKKSAKQENSSQFMNSILENAKIRVENSSLRRLEFTPGTWTKTGVQEFHLWKRQSRSERVKFNM